MVSTHHYHGNRNDKLDARVNHLRGVKLVRVDILIHLCHLQNILVLTSLEKDNESNEDT